MKRILWRTACLLLAVLLLLSFGGCEGGTDSGEEKVKIKIEFDDSNSIFSYIVELRDVFPEYEFELQSMVRRGHIDGLESTERASTILSQEAIHEDVADIIISDAFGADLPNLAGAFAEVSGEGYTARFQTSYLNNIAIDGKLYYLPFFVGLKGVVYNRTLFEEKGWQVPQNYEEFVELLATVDASGMPPIAVRTMTDFGAGLFSTADMVNDGSTLNGHQWLDEFAVGNPKAEPEMFAGTLDYLRMLGDVGHISDDPDLLEGIAHLMKKRQVAMCIASGESLSQIYNSGTHDKFAMMPLYSEEFPAGVIIEHNTLYLGQSAKAMADPAKEEALERIVDYIYSEQGQLRLLDICRGLVSPCYGLMDELASPSLAEFKRVLEGGNLVAEVAPFAVDSSFDEALTKFLEAEDTPAADKELLASLNEARALQIENDNKKQEAITEATANFSRQQVLNLLLAAIRTQTGSEVAVVPALALPDYYGHYHDTQLVRSKLYEGEVTLPVLESLLVRTFDVQTYTMSGAQLLDLVDNNKTNNLCLGLIPELTYDKERDVYYTTGAYLDNGERLDPAAEYTVAVPGNISIAEGGYSHTELFAQTLAETLASYCASQASITPFDLPEAKHIK